MVLNIPLILEMDPPVPRTGLEVLSTHLVDIPVKDSVDLDPVVKKHSASTDAATPLTKSRLMATEDLEALFKIPVVAEALSLNYYSIQKDPLLEIEYEADVEHAMSLYLILEINFMLQYIIDHAPNEQLKNSKIVCKSQQPGDPVPAVQTVPDVTSQKGKAAPTKTGDESTKEKVDSRFDMVWKINDKAVMILEVKNWYENHL
jgi:hypothetical protein